VTQLVIQALVGLLAGLLGGMLGIGGSVIIIPALIFYLHQTDAYTGASQHLLQAAAMICNVCIAAPSALAHWRAKAVMRSVVVILIPSALVGIFLGVTTSNSSAFARQNGVYLAMLLAGFLLYVACYNTWSFFRKPKSEGLLHEGWAPEGWKVAVVGTPMGFVAGLLGVGGGILAVPLQQIVLKVPLRMAIANSSATILCVSAVGALYKNSTLSSHGSPITASLQLASMLVPTAILGGYLGGRLTHVLPRKMLLVVFVVFMTTISLLTFNTAWTTAHGAG
jgi:uncharacterized membrane protein YfcA